MLDLGWPELLVVALVLIIVVGPKDLPGMLRTFGRTTKRLRSMAGEFRSQFDEALKEAELGDVTDVLNEAKQLNPTNILKEVVDPIREAGKDIKSDLDKAMREPDKPTVESKSETPLTGDPSLAKTATAKTKAPAKSKAKTTAAKPAAAKKPAARKTTARKPASKAAAAKSNGAAKSATTASSRNTAKKTTTATRSRSKTAASKTKTKSSGDTA